MSTVNLNLPDVQIREIRINSITGFLGNADDLVKLSADGLKDHNRKFTQCIGCSTARAGCMVSMVTDAAVISHGPVGCSSCLHDFNMTYRVNASLRNKTNRRRRIFSTNLQEKDTVYGGNAKLEATIREVYERVKPAAIFVLTTCAVGIVGDDVQSVCDKVQEELGIPIVGVACEGFRSKVWTTGFDAAYHGMARKLIKKADKHRDDMINVINFWGSDAFADWFAPFGAKPNYLTPFNTVEELSRAGEACATVQACSTLGTYLGAVLEQDFGVPELASAPPYGIAQTDRWFRALGKLLGKEDIAEKVIAEKKEKYLPQIEEIRKKLQGKTAYVAAGAAHGHALLDIIGELGLKAVGASVFHHDATFDSGRDENDQLKQRVGDYGDVPHFNVCNKQEFELVNALIKVHPDVMLARHGGMTLWGAKLGIPSLLVGDEHAGMGYEGLVKYGKMIVETIENDEFVKNFQKHALNPYTKWWLTQQTDYFQYK